MVGANFSQGCERTGGPLPSDQMHRPAVRVSAGSTNRPSKRTMHAAVFDVCGVVLEVEVTTGETNEGEELLARLDGSGRSPAPRSRR